MKLKFFEVDKNSVEWLETRDNISVIPNTGEFVEFELEFEVFEVIKKVISYNSKTIHIYVKKID